MRIIRVVPVVALFAVALAACGLFDQTFDELSLPFEPYTGDELRMDGYYATAPDDVTDNFAALLLYRNGALRYGGASTSRDSLESKLAVYGDRRYHWGVFVVDGDEIEMERWNVPQPFNSATYLRSGRILNDTTFVLRSSERELTYRFTAFSPKPDSTSTFLP
ncbi:MAG: hypothetical protein AAFQ53_01405 [Bacteroidota bacterium]